MLKRRTLTFPCVVVNYFLPHIFLINKKKILTNIMINNVDASAYIQPLSSEVIVQNTREKFLYCNMYGDLLKKKS